VRLSYAPPEDATIVDVLGADCDIVSGTVACLAVSLAVGEQLSAALAADTRFDVDGYIKALDDLPLPTAAEVGRALIEAARAEPGIAADRLFDSTLASLGSSSGGQTLEALVDRVLDDLADGPLYWLPDDGTVVVPDLVEPATFTHRLNEAEANSGVLTVGFDLESRSTRGAPESSWPTGHSN